MTASWSWIITVYSNGRQCRKIPRKIPKITCGAGPVWPNNSLNSEHSWIPGLRVQWSPTLYTRCAEAHRALELLEEYHSRLTHPHDRPLRLAIERIMRIFKSRLFQALVGEWVRLRLAVYTKVTIIGAPQFGTRVRAPHSRAVGGPTKAGKY